MTNLPDQPLVFSSLFEGMDKALGRKLREPPLSQKLAALGVDMDRLLPAYPEEVWEKAMEVIAASLYPDHLPQEQMRQLGQACCEGMLATALGAAAMGFARVIGMRRALKRVGQNFRSGSNYLVVETAERGPTELDMIVSVEPRFLPQWTGTSELIPHYTTGVLEVMVRSLRPRSHSTRLVEARTLERSARYRISWEE